MPLHSMPRMLSAFLVGSLLLVGVAGCARHADFVELRDQLTTIAKTQEQEQKRAEATQRRLESLEKAKESDVVKQRLEDALARLQKLEKLEGRLARLEDSQQQTPLAKTDSATETTRQAKTTKPSGPPDAGPMIPGVPSITPTSAFNLAYNDYLNGKYELAVTGFQRFLKDFPSTSLTPNAHYWLGESYYNMKDYVRAMQSFEHVVSEYPGNEKVPASLFKLGLSASETGDLAKSRKYLKRVIEEFSTSDEAKLAKAKLAEIR